ncbi:hypothetical protein ACFYS8_06940 [Kitasatospora sp. NPDC004615]|uniref:hypothetical protein n=1 Tax=Kitasatospora sp. NPDC004615 TaxID=3364017 RepID=UPI0036A735F7
MRAAGLVVAALALLLAGYLGEADGERGPYRIYLAAADHMPPGDPQLRVQRPTGMAVEQLSGWGSAPGPNPQDCSAS